MAYSKYWKVIPQFVPLNDLHGNICTFRVGTVQTECLRIFVQIKFVWEKMKHGCNLHTHWMHNWKVVTLHRAHWKLSSGTQFCDDHSECLMKEVLNLLHPYVKEARLECDWRTHLIWTSPALFGGGGPGQTAPVAPPVGSTDCKYNHYHHDYVTWCFRSENCSHYKTRGW